MRSDVWTAYEGQIVEGKYHLRTLLGTGGYGAVYMADEVVADRLMGRGALKLIRADQADIDKQLRELQATASLKHESILSHFVRGTCTLGGRDFLYIVMELAEETLAQRLQPGLPI
ncbi:MAG: hypothetical protein NT018_08850 [Armatimonadetes bacterium]|nr:hypothetical protein [Armatimonadota bacterium]